jgi:6-phosphogluconolactonase/glucosamine-6-phosphate isomerase/deaminase
MITTQKVTSNVKIIPSILGSVKLLGSRPPGPGDTRLTLTPSVIHNSNYVIVVSD